MNGQRILITGHRGFVGRSLRNFITATYPEAVVADPKDLIPFHSSEALKKLISEFAPDSIFHLASPPGETSSKDPQWLLENVIQPTTLLLDTVLSVRAGARVIIPGSAAEYGVVPADHLPVTEDFAAKPISPYGKSKLLQTLATRTYAEKGLHVMVGRIFNIIGKDAPEHTLTGSFLSKLRIAMKQSEKNTMHVGNLGIRRDFVDIEDVCRALTMIAKSGHSGRIYNVCSGHSVSLRDVLKKMISSCGTSVEVIEESGLVPNPVLDIFGSPERIRHDTGWSPKYRWDESVARTL